MIEKKDIQIFEHTITKWFYDEESRMPYGVLLQITNGDTQYMTIQEYNILLKK